LWLGLAAWRWMFLAMTIPAVAYGLLTLVIPESPRYLIATFRIPEARRILSMLLGERGVDLKVERIRETLQHEKRPSWADLRAPRTGLLPIVWVGLGLSVFQQFVGINVIFYYSTTLWQAVGFTESDSLTISVLTSVTNIVVTFVAIALVDRVGRRRMLIAGSIGMTVSLGVMAIAFGQSVFANGSPSLPGAWGPIALVAANVFVIAFGASWGPLVWVLLGEIFPNSIRGRALGLAAAAQWIANFLVTVTFPVLSAFSLPFTYGMYAVFAALSLIFVVLRVPETKGTSLDDADSLARPVLRRVRA
jgi:SP family sugar:H+ symporter-like MFS transporter